MVFDRSGNFVMAVNGTTCAERAVLAHIEAHDSSLTGDLTMVIAREAKGEWGYIKPCAHCVCAMKAFRMPIKRVVYTVAPGVSEDVALSDLKSDYVTSGSRRDPKTAAL